MQVLILYRCAFLGLLFASVSCWVIALSGVRAIDQDRRGYRAVARARGLNESQGFRLVEPLIRWFGGLMRAVLDLFPKSGAIARLRERQAIRLEQAGDYLGFVPDELSGAMLLALLVFGCAGWLLSVVFHQGLLYLVLGVVGGPVLVHLQVDSEMRRRIKAIARRLPAAIDLAALCTSAGLDFPASLTLVAREAPAEEPLGQEIRRLLDALNLGQTRREALAAWERRVPTASVRELVRALTQAEEKGTPISEALLTQAQVSRGQRTVLAEELATRAGVLMIIPMVLMFGCIMLLLVGPFLVTGAGF